MVCLGIDVDVRMAERLSDQAVGLENNARIYGGEHSHHILDAAWMP
jgi:hypothetical protein